MRKPLFWQTEGQGLDLVLIHGWGMNGAVWHNIVMQLSQHYRVHAVDLPGYGHSGASQADSFEQMCEWILEEAPENAIWLGWSLGGLVATHITQVAPERVSKLITVASSPSFADSEQWKGIKPEVLNNFIEQLSDNFRLTVERFMALQAMGSPTARQDVKQVKKAVFSRPVPEPQVLAQGLKILADTDLRGSLTLINQPFLRLYGRLDGLVPVNVAEKVSEMSPRSESYIFQNASHAPFISHSEEFIEVLQRFIDN